MFRESGVTVMKSTMGGFDDSLESTLSEIALYQQLIEVHPDLFMQVRRPSDFAAAKRENKSAGTQVAVGESERDPNYVPRFKQRYNDVIRPELMKQFGYKNVLQAPRIEKIVLNIGAGEGAADQKKIQSAQNDLTAIAGQKAVITRAKKAISAFKITARDASNIR